MDITDLSKVYNKANTKNITQKLKLIKMTFGNKLFELLLKDILDKNKAGIDQTVRLYTKEPGGVDLDIQRDIRERNNALARLKNAIEFANRYDYPEAECEDCGKVASDVLIRPNIGRKLCTACYEKLVPHTKVSPAITRAVIGAYGEPSKDDEFELPDFLQLDPNDDDTDILV